MFCKPIALVSARCHLRQHDLCVADRCDCDCHTLIAIGNRFWNHESGRNGDESHSKCVVPASTPPGATDQISKGRNGGCSDLYDVYRFGGLVTCHKSAACTERSSARVEG
jgi:hypothetical protein